MYSFLLFLTRISLPPQEVLAHITAENKYTEEKMAHLSGLREDLYKVNAFHHPYHSD